MQNNSASFTTGEEIFNAITHGVGALLSIAGLVVLVVLSAFEGSAAHVAAFSVYGATMVILYLSSTIYHSLTHASAKRLFRKFDHMSIFLLIAGSYTPFCLTVLPSWIGWSIFGVVWTAAIGGIIIKAFHTGKYERLSTFLYIMMGWLVLVAIKPLYDAVSADTLWLLGLSGFFYTMGTFFFLKDRIKYFHSIWHLFVLAGSTFHFFAVITILR